MIGDIPASDSTELEVSETGWSFLFVGLVVERRSAVVVLSLGVVVLVEVELELEVTVVVRDEVNNK